MSVSTVRAELRQTTAALKRCQRSLAAALAHAQWLTTQLNAAERRAVRVEKRKARQG